MQRVRAAGRVVHLDVQSRALRGNPLGDPARRRLPVYLPPGYDDAPTARYPVLYALTGFTGRGAMLLNTTNWGEPLHVRLDRLYGEGRIGPMIVAMPDCFTRYGGSQYVNSSAVGRYADHLVHEIVPLVDRSLRTLAVARHRGIFGKSSGGYGAIVHGMLHPGVFGAVACHSGDMAFEYCLFPDFPKLLQQIERHGSAPAFLRAFEAAPRKTNDLIAAINIFAMAACYAPNPRARPLGFDLPFDPRTGAVDAAVWRRWLAHDPLRMLPRRASALRRLRLLFLDCGRRDEFNLLWGARQMTAALREQRIRHVYEEFDDGHMDISYRYDRSLPHLWEAVRPPVRAGSRPRSRITPAPAPSRRRAARPAAVSRGRHRRRHRA